MLDRQLRVVKRRRRVIRCATLAALSLQVLLGALHLQRELVARALLPRRISENCSVTQIQEESDVGEVR